MKTLHQPTSALTVGLARPGHDDRGARALFRAQRAWLADIGIDPGDHYPEARREYADPVGHYRAGALVLARRDGEAIGMVALAPLDRAVGELRRFFVHPAARGLGAGPALLERLITIARGRGYRRLLLETLPGEMDTAIGLYRRFGFRDTDTFHLSLPGVIGMQLDLENPA